MPRPVTATLLRIGAALAFAPLAACTTTNPPASEPHDPTFQVTRIFPYDVTDATADDGDIITRLWRWDALTADVVANALVTVHWRPGPESPWRSLPFVSLHENGSVAELSYGFHEGYLHVTIESRDHAHAASLDAINADWGAQIRANITARARDQLPGPRVYATRIFPHPSDPAPDPAHQEELAYSWAWHALTEDVVANAVVVVHWRHDAESVWRPLPFVHFRSDGSVAELSYTYEPGTFEITIDAQEPSHASAIDETNRILGAEFRVTVYLP